ncbi:MAG: acylphosphatase [Candidatus Diapherotrites archaeon]|uniref:acylphosphatase n=1 Tax=Candidatus Iainarchaeum sp. TaxID=3101447 RepID=A0A8T4L1H4_9ARCH|nr:acylphosphatase [Candidatus Diapherotrites archaeon]
MIRKRLIVRGNIQGVGYRALVKQAARSLGIKGLVRNLDDGSVKIFCEGAEGQLKQFERSIDVKGRTGLFSINVEKIESYAEGSKNYINAPAEFRVFEIDYDMEAASPFEKANLERLEIGILVMSEFKDETRQSFDKMDKKYDKMSNKLSETKDVLSDNLSDVSDRLSDKISDVSGNISKGFGSTQNAFKTEFSKFGKSNEMLAKSLIKAFKR